MEKLFMRYIGGGDLMSAERRNEERKTFEKRKEMQTSRQKLLYIKVLLSTLKFVDVFM